MKRRNLALVVALGTLLPFSSGCFVEERPRREVVVEPERGGGPPPWAPAHGYSRQVERYEYYPDIEVYYYPNVRRYYWLERGEWRFGAQPPPRFVLRERERVTLDLDYEPHTQHAKIKSNYPPGQYRKLEREDDRRERKEDWREEKKGKSGY